jgi:peptidoglycan/xylan/chitin deacetylase (PgdA/CDA1 family)
VKSGLLKRGGVRALSATVLPLSRLRRGGPRVAVLMYHDPSPETLERHVESLRKHHTIIPLRRLVEALESGSLAELPPDPVVITLDDGHRRNVLLTDTLTRLEIPATIFLCSGLIGTDSHFWFLDHPDPERLKRLPDAERIDALESAGLNERAEHTEAHALSADDIAAMKNAVDFQSHTVSHPILTACDDDKARSEIAVAKNDLEERFGLEIYALAYPNGDYGAREIRLAREAGYRCAVTVDPGFVTDATDTLRLPRFAVDDDRDDAATVMLKVSGIWASLKRFSALVRRK